LPTLVLTRRNARADETWTVVVRCAAREDRPALLPLQQPFRAIGQIVVEHGGHAARQFVAHRRIRRIEISTQTRRGIPGQRFIRLSQQPVAAPDKPVRRERRMPGHFDHAADLRPQPLREVTKIDIRADALARRDIELEAAPHRRARDDHGLRGPGIGRRFCQVVEQRADKGFVAVRVEELEHGFRRNMRRERNARAATDIEATA
jgi:hypothetical protein